MMAMRSSRREARHLLFANAFAVNRLRIILKLCNFLAKRNPPNHHKGYHFGLKETKTKTTI